MRVCHGGNYDDLVSIPAMTGTVAVNICVYFNGLYIYIYYTIYIIYTIYRLAF